MTSEMSRRPFVKDEAPKGQYLPERPKERRMKNENEEPEAASIDAGRWRRRGSHRSERTDKEEKKK